MQKLPFELIQETDLEKWRADTFWTKEPETLEWIRAFNPKGYFFDVGANIGIYSLYAASLFPNALIIAIEPQLTNFSRLCKNILINDFKNIIPVFGGCGNFTTVSVFHEKEDIPGATGGFFCQTLAHKQQTPIYALDNLAKQLVIPDYIKIDTDGHELIIIKGMVRLLSHAKIKSMLIEIKKKEKDFYLKFLENLKYVPDYSYDNIIGHSKHRRSIEGIDVENIIFKRAD